MTEQRTQTTVKLRIPMNPKKNRRHDHASTMRTFTIEDRLVAEAWENPTAAHLIILAALVRTAEAEMRRQWERLPDPEKAKVWIWPFSEKDRCLLHEVDQRCSRSSSSTFEAERLYSSLEAIGTPDEIAFGAVKALRSLNHRYKYWGES